MRHSIWFTHMDERRPAIPDSQRDPHAGDARPSTGRATLRLRVRSLLAFAAMVLFLASVIEFVAVLMSREGATVPFGVAGVCIAIAIVATLAATRNPRQ